MRVCAKSTFYDPHHTLLPKVKVKRFFKMFFFFLFARPRRWIHTAKAEEIALLFGEKFDLEISGYKLSIAYRKMLVKGLFKSGAKNLFGGVFCHKMGRLWGANYERT